MSDRTANLLGALGLLISDRIERVARDVLNRSGETPAALVVIGYGLGPSNNRLRDVLGLSHPGAVRLVDRLVKDGLVERRQGKDARTLALHLTPKGHEVRATLLSGRLSAMASLIGNLEIEEQDQLGALIAKVLGGLGLEDRDRCRTCRLCDADACLDCPIPAEFKTGSQDAVSRS